MTGPGSDVAPRSAVVVGARIVGLSTAWFLQDRGMHVTVVERDEVGAGASWGNAGWLSPGLAMPLTSPHVLAEGLQGLTSARAPLSIPVRPDRACGASCCASPRTAPPATGGAGRGELPAAAGGESGGLRHS